MNKYMLLGIISLVFLLCQCSNESEKQGGVDNNINLSNGTGNSDVNTCLPDVADKYEFHYEVSDFASTEEFIKAFQLPESVLKTIPTKGLIRTILDLPLLSASYLASSNSSPLGTSYGILSQYNIATELENRKDAAEVLAFYYGSIQLNCLDSLSTADRTRFSVQLAIIEALFTKKKILEQIGKKEKKQLIASLLSKYKEKQHYSAEGFIADGTLSAIAWILYDDQYAPVVEYYKNQQLVADYFQVNTDQTINIISFAENYTH